MNLPSVPVKNHLEQWKVCSNKKCKRVFKGKGERCDQCLKKK